MANQPLLSFGLDTNESNPPPLDFGVTPSRSSTPSLPAPRLTMPPPLHFGTPTPTPQAQTRSLAGNLLHGLWGFVENALSLKAPKPMVFPVTTPAQSAAFTRGAEGPNMNPRDVKGQVLSAIPFTTTAKDLIKRNVFVTAEPLPEGIGGQTKIPDYAPGSRPTVNEGGVSSIQITPDPSLPLANVSHEVFNALFAHSNIDPNAFNVAWEKARASNPDMAAIDNELHDPTKAAAYEGNGESVTKDPYMLASERFALMGSLWGNDGLASLPKDLQGYYAPYLANKTATIKTPFAATPLGIGLETIKPGNLVRAASQVGMSIIQASASTAAAIPASIVQLFNPHAQGAPITSPFMQRLLGEKTQESFQEMAGHAAANEPYPAEGIIGALANPLAKRLAASPTAQRLGLDKAAPILAVGSVIGDSLMNLAGFGDLSGDRALVEALVHETDAGKVGGLLRQNGVSPSIADKMAPTIADMKSAKDVEDALRLTTALQHTSDTTEALHPGAFDEGAFNSPAANADWEANFADRYAELNTEMARLEQDAKASAGAARELAPKIAAINEEGAAIEKAFLEKWAAPQVDRAGIPAARALAPESPALAETAPLAAGGPVDVTNMSREAIAAKAAELKANAVPNPSPAGAHGDNVGIVGEPPAVAPPGAPAPPAEFGPNDTVRLTAKSTGQTQDRTVVRTNPDGSLIVRDELSGLPMRVNPDRFDVALLQKGDNAAPLPKTGVTFGELRAQERLAGVNPAQAEKLAPEAVEPLAQKAADRYWDEVIQPARDRGEAVVIGADDLKDHFGGDYNDLNHPIYSRAAFKLYERALKEQPGDVFLTGGGPGSGKTEILVKTLTQDLGFNGIVYDSTMASGEGVVKQIQMAHDAGKNVEIFGILPDLERARQFTLAREAATGRGISDKTFARGHTAFPQVVGDLINKGAMPAADVHILDYTKTAPTIEQAKSDVRAGLFLKDPLAKVESLGYNEANVVERFAKDRVGQGGVAPAEQPGGAGGTGREHSGVSAQDRGAGEVNAPPPADAPVITTSEDDSLALAARQQEDWGYDLRYDPTQETERDLEEIFANLEGVSLDDLHTTLTAEDLANAKTAIQIGEETLLDHPGRPLMKYVSRQTGELPEMSKFTANKNVSKSRFAKEGDKLVQDLLGQDVTNSGDLVRAQELVDEYRALKARVDGARANFSRIRKTIQAQKKAGTFVRNAQRTIAREVAKDTAALRNMLQSAERAGFTRGVAKGEQMVADMVGKLKARRERILAIQEQYRLPDRQMKKIMGRKDPRFMDADQFEKYVTGLAQGAERARNSLDRYGPLPTPGEEIIGTGGGDSGWQSLLRNWYKNQGTKSKVNLTDYLATPEYVLERLGLGDVAEKLHMAQDSYVKTRDLELSRISEWMKRAGDRPEANTRIFRWLDGQERFVAPEMSAQELEVAHEIRDYLKGWADRLNLPEDNRIAKYITHLFEPGANEPGNIFDDPELANLMRQKVAGSVYDPFLEARLGKKGYKEDTWAALDAYVKRATRKEAFDPVLDDMVERAKGFDESVYNYVARLSHGINMRPTETDKLIDNLITNGMKITRFTDRPTAYLANKVRQGFYRGTIGLNLSSALRNLSQGANTYAKLGEKYTTIGYSKVAWRLAKGDLGELYDSGVLADDYLQDRKVGVYKTALQKLDPALFYVFETAEKINRGAAFYGAKAKAAAKGLSPEEATAYAKRIVRETQFSFNRVDTPVGLNNDVAKTLVQLQTYNLKQLEFLGRMVRNHEWAGLVRFTVATLAFVDTIGRLFNMNLSQVVPSVSITGSPFSSGVSALYNLAFGRNNPQQQANYEREVRNLILARVPGGIQLIGKTIPGIETVAAGKDVTPGGRTRFTVPQDFGHYLQAALFGKNSLQEAQAYYDSLNQPAKPAAPAPL